VVRKENIAQIFFPAQSSLEEVYLFTSVMAVKFQKILFSSAQMTLSILLSTPRIYRNPATMAGFEPSHGRTAHKSTQISCDE